MEQKKNLLKILISEQLKEDKKYSSLYSILSLESLVLTRLDTMLEYNVKTKNMLILDFDINLFLSFLESVSNLNINVKNFIFKFDELKDFSKKDCFLIAKKLFELNFNNDFDILFENENVKLVFKNTIDFETFKSNYERPLKFYFKTYGLEEIVIDILEKQNIKKEALTSKDFVISENIETKKDRIIKKSKINSKESKTLLINEIPSTKEELNSFDDCNVSIEGEIFEIQTKDIKRNVLITLSVTDYYDSITVKMFVSKKDFKDFDFNVGESIQVCGEIKFDDFSKEILIQSDLKDIIKIDKVFKKEITFDDVTFLRSELHIHSNFSTQDGISTVEEYFTNAKKMGLNALAFTDHENVQAFPEVVKMAQKSGIKPIYGVEFNVVDEKEFKIVNKRNGKSNSYVALDIETTGLSCVYDDITEISCIKYVGEKRLEYSVLIKLDDYSKLSSKITEITGIDKELLENNGVDIKEALKGLIDFIGNSYIIAHNATFDIPFIEYKIKEVLGISVVYSYIDTLTLAKTMLTEQKRFGLGSVAKKCGIKFDEEEHHRAIYDANACYDIFKYFMNSLSNNKITNFDNFKECDFDKNIKYQTTFSYKTRKAEVSLRNFIEENNFKIINENSIETFNEEEGYFKIDAVENFLTEYEQKVQEENPHFEFDATTTNDNYDDDKVTMLIRYKNEETKKLLSKIKSAKGAKKNVFSFENVITKPKNATAKGEITVGVYTYQELLTLKNFEDFKELVIINKYYIEDVNRLNELINNEEIFKKIYPYHITTLVKNQQGLKDLFKLISLSHTKYLTNKAIITKNELNLNRSNLLIGTSCYNGLFRTAFEKGMEKFSEEVEFYDYVEIQPLECYNSYNTERNQNDNIIDTLKKIINVCKEKNILCVATSDAHYITDEFKDYRDIYIETPIVGGGLHDLYKKTSPTNSLKSTNEMISLIKEIDSINYIDLVVNNSLKISSMIDDNIRVIWDKLFTPTDDFMASKGIPSVIEEFKRIVYNNVKKYEVNGKLPLIIEKRLEKEMNSIIGNGFAVIYYIAYLLVKKSNDDGYIVGSRGSVGSSFVATLMNITEVNPLAPHYYCSKCHFTEFKGEKTQNSYPKLQTILDKTDDGFDLPDEICPLCGNKLSKDGHDIPFETFLGFDGDKVPDIDLNFSGEYQAKAHNFCKEIFGEKNAFRAGTISTVAEKTAFGMVKKHSENHGKTIRNAECGRRAKVLEGVKRTTGQHPGGIIIIPSNFNVLDFTPVQYPANDSSSSWLTTHFDFHSIHDNVLKLDILGHDDPTVLKYLMDYVKSHPTEFPFNDIKDIPLDDKEVYQLLYPNDKDEVKSLAIPEFGTNFVNEMLKDTKPKTFAELVKVSGLSHGTDVWLNNAKDLVLGETKYDTIDFAKVIGCRDDIMVDLMYMGLEPAKAFEIMEFVRKGKPSKEKDKWMQHQEYMRNHNIPEWYIWSCGQIKYMFPKAHATAYVLSAMRIAWFKVHKPLLFYSAFFSIRAKAIDLETIIGGKDLILFRMNEIRDNKNATDIEKAEADTFEVVLEAMDYGITFEKPNLNISEAINFVPITSKNALVMSFTSIAGLGINVAEQIINERKIRKFEDFDDFKNRNIVNKTVLAKIKEMEEFNDF